MYTEKLQNTEMKKSTIMGKELKLISQTLTAHADQRISKTEQVWSDGQIHETVLNNQKINIL